MNKCTNCNLYVYDDTDVCPLCHSVLDEVAEEDKDRIGMFSPQGAPYPDVKKRRKQLHFALR